MTTVTLNADETLLDKARKILEERSLTLDDVFSIALLRLTEGERRSFEYRELMADLKHVNSGGRFSREEMNDRY